MDRGNYTGARFYLEQTLKSKPNDPRILSNIGSVLLEAGNYSGAISFYKGALAFTPHHIGALAGIGYASESLGNRSAALIYFKKAIAQPIPSDNNGLLERALAFSHLSNFSQALDEIQPICML
jgi:tetratricopeptide (TPR) repeat protein